MKMYYIEMIKKNIEKIDEHGKKIAYSKIDSWTEVEKLAICYDAKKFLYSLLEKHEVENYKKQEHDSEDKF